MTLQFVLVVALAFVTFILGARYGVGYGRFREKQRVSLLISEGYMAFTEKGQKVIAESEKFAKATTNVSA